MPGPHELSMLSRASGASKGLGQAVDHSIPAGRLLIRDLHQTPLLKLKERSPRRWPNWELHTEEAHRRDLLSPEAEPQATQSREQLGSRRHPKEHLAAALVVADLKLEEAHTHLAWSQTSQQVEAMTRELLFVARSMTSFRSWSSGKLCEALQRVV